MADKVAIKVEGVSKSFRIPHEKSTSLKSAALNIFKRKGYTEFNAANSITFEVNKGEFVGIIGRNGSGKSTLLKMLAGIYVPDKGKIKVNGRLSPFLELGVGFNPELTARENVYLGGAILGLNKKEIDEKFDEIIEFAELEEFVDMKFKNYSSGMQVRLAFSLSIFAHAEILLMDEVLAVGDSNFQAKCLEEFNKYRDQGKTVILVTHDVNTVEKYCDRAILLRNGKVVKIGHASEVANLYNQQNMEDEEERSRRSQKTTAKTSLGKEVEVTAVKTLDKEGNDKTTFSSGDSIKIEIYYKIRRPVKSLNFSIGVRTGEGILVLAFMTEKSKYDASLNGGKIVLSVDELNLLQGRYYLNITAYGKEYGKKYDFRPKAKRISVFNTEDKIGQTGLMYIKHSWSQELGSKRVTKEKKRNYKKLSTWRGNEEERKRRKSPVDCV